MDVSLGHDGAEVTDVAQVMDEFSRILDGRMLRTVFQPIVSLSSGGTVGYESLVRGPEDSAFASAGSLLKAAYASERVAEFDWAARASACRAALAADLDPDQLLFMNVEPLALDSECPPDLWPDIDAAFTRYRVMLEVTERSLDRDPGTLLDGLDRQRHRVQGLAVDDVGSVPATLAMMPLIGPAVIKLDVTVTQGTATKLAKTLDIVYEEAERTGATILAEGIENRDHANLARSVGIAYGQGHYLGQPASLAEHKDRPRRRVEVGARVPPSVDSPIDALSASPTGRATPDLLTPLIRRVESSIESAPVPALLISHVPDASMFGESERRRYASLANRGATTAVLGPGIPAEPGDGIRGIGLRDAEPLDGDWAVVALNPSAAGAVLAHTSGDRAQEFDYGVTHNTERVIAAARCLFRRLGAPTPQWTPNHPQ
jgi:EAL domain-containing protein (putative c-di-GMP-specific phosphodiesterase class I)